MQWIRNVDTREEWFTSTNLDMWQEIGYLECFRFPMHWPDKMIERRVKHDEKGAIYLGSELDMKIIGIGSWKSVLFNLTPRVDQSLV